MVQIRYIFTEFTKFTEFTEFIDTKRIFTDIYRFFIVSTNFYLSFGDR